MNDTGYMPALATAILAAQRAVEAALKTSVNKFHNYKYASAEEVLIVGREALHGAGLVMVPVSEDFEPLQEIDDRCGGAVATVRCKYAVIHESGASMLFSTDVPVVPERGKSSGWSRPADKATFGARTEALGYALRDLLLIPREDAPDVSGRRDGERTGPGPRQPPAPPPPMPQTVEPATLEQCLRSIKEAKTSTDAAKAVALARRERPTSEHPHVERAFAEWVYTILREEKDAERIEKIFGFVTRAALADDQATATANAAIAAARARAVPQ